MEAKANRCHFTQLHKQVAPLWILCLMETLNVGNFITTSHLNCKRFQHISNEHALCWASCMTMHDDKSTVASCRHRQIIQQLLYAQIHCQYFYKTLQWWSIASGSYSKWLHASPTHFRYCFYHKIPTHSVLTHWLTHTSFPCSIITLIIPLLTNPAYSLNGGIKFFILSPNISLWNLKLPNLNLYIWPSHSTPWVELL